MPVTAPTCLNAAWPRWTRGATTYGPPAAVVANAKQHFLGQAILPARATLVPQSVALIPPLPSCPLRLGLVLALGLGLGLGLGLRVTLVRLSEVASRQRCRKSRG